MIRYSIELSYRIFVKDYGFLYFAKNIGKYLGKYISKTLSGKYSQKCLNHAKKSATYAIKTVSKNTIQKTTEARGDLVSNKIVDKITKVSKSSP